MSSKDTHTIGDSLEETKEFHRRYQRAVNNPVRRRILVILMDIKRIRPEAVIGWPDFHKIRQPIGHFFIGMKVIQKYPVVKIDKCQHFIDCILQVVY